MKNILAPVDFSDLAVNVIEMAAKLALAFNSKLWIVHVMTKQPYFVGLEMGAEVVEEIKQEEVIRMQKDISAMEQYVIEKGIDAESLLLNGKVIQVIIDQSLITESDIIVIGSKNLGFFNRAFLGSISEGVLKKASCPVLIITDND